MRRISVVLVAGLALGACGGDSTKSGISNPNDLANALGTAFCQLEQKCGSVGASEEKQCEADAMSQAMKFPPAYDPNEAVTNKRMNFDPKAAQACIDAVKASGCTVDQQNAANAICNGVFTPNVDAGGMCTYSGECKNGYCDRPQRIAGCPGTCKAFTQVAVGGDCSAQDATCDATAFCDPNTNTCSALLAQGMQCGDEICQNGLFCVGLQFDANGNVTAMGTCGPASAAGGPCLSFSDGSTDCQPGLYCDSTTNKCTARGGAGTVCQQFETCADGTVCIGLMVDSNGNITGSGSCTNFGDIGSACDASALVSVCPFDATCDMTAMTCKAVGVAGDDCSSSGTFGFCRAGLYCDSGGSNQCKPQDAYGASCMVPMSGEVDPCNDGTCNNGTCSLMCM